MSILQKMDVIANTPINEEEIVRHKDGRTVRLLLVEDNEADAQILSFMLENASLPLDITRVEDGGAAVEYLLKQGEYSTAQRPDLVILDVNLPKKSGFEVLAEIRQNPLIAELPVFILSTTRYEEDIKRAEALGIGGFFQKPIEISDYEALAAKISEVEIPKIIPNLLPISKSREKITPLPSEVTASLSGEELFRQLVGAVRDYAIFMLDPAGNILSWNEGAVRIKGYKPSEIIGKHFSIFYTEEALARNHPAHELEIAKKTGRYEEEGWRVRKDGTHFWANVTITAIRNPDGKLLGFGKVTRDLTERRAADQALRESERKFRLLVDGATDYGIFLLSPDGIITSWNQGADRITGYTESEILGKHFSIFYSPAAIEKHLPELELQKAAKNGAIEEEQLRVRKDGSTFWANVVITALYNKEGNLQGFSKITRDISERKKQEEQLKRLTVELEQRIRERTSELEESRRTLTLQKEQLSRSNAELKQFAYVASHDLQEPIRAVVMSLQLLERAHRDDLPEKSRTYINLAVDNSKRMKSLVQGLLNYARVGKVSGSEGPTDLNIIVKECERSLSNLILKNEAILAVDRLPTLMVDRTEFLQLFQNLISNALKYRGESAPAIKISANEQPGHFHFSVKDNGIGIHPKYHERIFVIFQRLHARQSKYQGTGIGLAICKKIVESYGGKIWVESEEGSGSTFHFTLPERLDSAHQE